MPPWRHVHLTVTAAGPPSAAPRSWRLEGYAKGESKKPAHSSVCHSDRELDDAMRVLEGDPTIVRIAVRPA